MQHKHTQLLLEAVVWQQATTQAAHLADEGAAKHILHGRRQLLVVAHLCS